MYLGRAGRRADRHRHPIRYVDRTHPIKEVRQINAIAGRPLHTLLATAQHNDDLVAHAESTQHPRLSSRQPTTTNRDAGPLLPHRATEPGHRHRVDRIIYNHRDRTASQQIKLLCDPEQDI